MFFLFVCCSIKIRSNYGFLNLNSAVSRFVFVTVIFYFSHAIIIVQFISLYMRFFLFKSDIGLEFTVHAAESRSEIKIIIVVCLSSPFTAFLAADIVFAV